jgi:hypothetical protein
LNSTDSFVGRLTSVEPAELTRGRTAEEEEEEEGGVDDEFGFFGGTRLGSFFACDVSSTTGLSLPDEDCASNVSKISSISLTAVRLRSLEERSTVALTRCCLRVVGALNGAVVSAFLRAERGGLAARSESGGDVRPMALAALKVTGVLVLKEGCDGGVESGGTELKKLGKDVNPLT